MQTLWFKRKLYGWGWYPVTWQGWLAILVYVAVIATFEIWFIDLCQRGAVTGYLTALFVLRVTVPTLVLILLCYKTGEKPRWQWGTRIED